MERFLTYVKPRPDIAADCEIVCDWNAYPSMHISELEKAVASGRGNAAMEKEIAERKAGTSKPKVTPQIMGGKAQVRVGRM